MEECEIVRMGLGGGFEQAISRILCLCCLMAAQVATIYLGLLYSRETLLLKKPQKRFRTAKTSLQMPFDSRIDSYMCGMPLKNPYHQYMNT
jgi:hypothetical protein